jgi:hypothetical protein
MLVHTNFFRYIVMGVGEKMLVIKLPNSENGIGGTESNQDRTDRPTHIGNSVLIAIGQPMVLLQGSKRGMPTTPVFSVFG